MNLSLYTEIISIEDIDVKIKLRLLYDVCGNYVSYGHAKSREAL